MPRQSTLEKNSDTTAFIVPGANPIWPLSWIHHELNAFHANLTNAPNIEQYVVLQLLEFVQRNGYIVFALTYLLALF